MDRTQLPPSYLAENNSKPLLDVCITFIVIETVFISLLFISRYLNHDQKSGMGMLSFMTIGYLVCMGKVTIGILMVKIGGAGIHLRALELHTISNALKLQTALQIVCPLTTSLTKLAVCCFFLHIFGLTSRTYQHVIKGTFILILCVLFVQVLIPFANCKPFSYTWNKMIDGKCAMDGIVLWRYLSIPNIVTDVIMVAIPIPALYKLHVSVATKIGLCVCFLTCAFGIAAAVLRFHSFLLVRDFSDITYRIIYPLVWTIAESGIYIIAGVIPTLRPLVRRIFKDVDFDKHLSRSFGWTGQSGSRESQKLDQGGEEGKKREVRLDTIKGLDGGKMSFGTSLREVRGGSSDYGSEKGLRGSHEL